MFKRIFLIVLDSVGCGSLPDADKYGDAGANTLLHIAEKMDNFKLPALFTLGLGKIIGLKITEQSPVTGIYGKMTERSFGKDTQIGHWEIAGIISDKPLPVFPYGFPRELLERFLIRTGLKGYLGNKAASGTEIIQELGQEHIQTGFPIIYTSADSVFQIAAHEDIIPIKQQYEICLKARELLKSDYGVGRVIARPFIGEKDHFTRTEKRRDFGLEPPDSILTSQVQKAGYEVIGIGKIEDIINHKGLTRSFHTGNNTDGIAKIRDLIINTDFKGLVFANLVDFDMIYGHRRDVQGYYKALQEFDQALAEYLDLLSPDDAVFITADHGNDPTYRGTDHTREYVPVLGYSFGFKQDVYIGLRGSFADLGQTIAEMLQVQSLPAGKSFLRKIIKQ